MRIRSHLALDIFQILFTVVYTLSASQALAVVADAVDISEPKAEPRASAETADDQQTLSHYVKQMPSDYVAYFRNMTGYQWSTYAAVAGSTLLLMPYDQHIADSSHDYALKHRLMIEGDHYGHLASWHLLGKTVDFPYPKNDVTSFAWYVGDGLFSLELMAGFAWYGYFSQDQRSRAISLQIFESLLITASMVMPLKMLTGRESPLRASASGGRWHGFPGLATYINNQARYYSYPSGHTAAAVSTLTVIAENYADQTWIMPVGGVMVGLLMFALMNVGSHWPSDYPLAIMIGYTSGHTVFAEHKAGLRAPAQARAEVRKAVRSFQWQGVTPTCMDLYCGVSTQWQF